MKRGLALGALVIGLLTAAAPALAEGCAFSWGGTCLIAGGTATATPAPSPSPTATPQPAPVTQPIQQVTDAAKPVAQPAVDVLEDLLLEKVNAERRLAGLASLAVNGWARTTAREHSGRMAQANDLWHNSAYMSQGRAAMGATLLGENVAMGTVLDAAHAQLMASEPHRRNLLDARFTHVGIGIAAGVGFLYVTEDFARIAGAAPAAPAARAPAAAPRPAPAKP
ncbi:MAG: CAP domain-containing protein, partial [Actinomycetota bacterium]